MVLNTDLSKHFSLQTELKTKLGNDFPNGSIEDRRLILSVALRLCDQFKIVRNKHFSKWMDKMFSEFFKQGEMEKTLDLPISKFMDSENTNKEKAYVNYINVVCRPLFNSFCIFMHDEEVQKELIDDGIDKNKKNLEHRIDGESK
jgi:hypothetical protein